MYIPNDYAQNYPVCKQQWVVETLGKSTNQSKLNKSLQSC